MGRTHHARGLGPWPLGLVLRSSVILLAAAHLQGARGEGVIVVGAGAAGVAAATRLREAGVTDVLVLEGSSYLGGRIRSSSLSGTTVELGANWVVGDSRNPLSRLAQEHSLDCTITDWESWADYEDNGRTEATQDAWGNAEEWGEAYDEMAQKYNADDAPDRSVDDVVVKSGWTERDRYNEAVIFSEFEYGHGEFLGKLSFKAYASEKTFAHFSNDWTYDKVHCFVNDPRGYSYLLESMLSDANISDTIRYGQMVRSISYTEQGVVVESQDNIFQADHVIITVSVGVLQSGAIAFHPSLPEWKSDAANKFGMGQLLKIFFEFPSQFWPEEEFHMYASETRGYYPVWQNMNHPTALGPGPPHVLMVSLTGPEAERVRQQPENATVLEALQVLGRMFSSEPIPQPTRVLSKDWKADPLFGGTWVIRRVGSTLADKDLLCAPVGRVWFAGEACHPDYEAYVHAALLSGSDTAAAVARCHLLSTGCPDGTPGFAMSSAAASLVLHTWLWGVAASIACARG